MAETGGGAGDAGGPPLRKPSPGQIPAHINALLSTINAVRRQAEESYDALPIEEKAEMMYMALTVEAAFVSAEGRMLAAIMLRRIVTACFEDFFPKMSQAQQAQFQQDMLMALEQEPSRCVRKRVADLVAEVARQLIDDSSNFLWPDFLTFFFKMASSSNPEMKEDVQHFDAIKNFLLSSLTGATMLEVRLIAVKAAVNFLLLHKNKANCLEYFKDMLVPLLDVTMDSIEKDDNDMAVKSLIDLAEKAPKFLRPQLGHLFEVCTQLFTNADKLESMRQLSLEVIVTSAVSAPAMVRKEAEDQLGNVIWGILKVMTEIEEEDDWAVSDEEPDDWDSIAVVAQSALDRLARALGGKTVFPYVLNATSQMLQNPDWKYRHAALMAISACAEGCYKQMASYLTQMMDGVMNFRNDPHPRVRFALCTALAQMAIDFSPIFQKRFHSKVIPGLVHLMDDMASPRVQAEAGAALLFFSEDCTKRVLTPYLDGIIAKMELVLVSKLDEFVKKGNKLVLSQVVSTISTVANTAEDKFATYYDRFVPCFKYIIQNADKAELRLLRGKTIECFSIIGSTVGTEKFLVDAGEVMEMLLKTQNGEAIEMSDDDPQLPYMISAWAKICKIMGSKFAPYLPQVMGPVLRTASFKPEVALLDKDEMAEVKEDSDEKWKFIRMDDDIHSFGIKTAGLEDKVTACEMLVCYARELKEHFVEYAEQTVELMVDHLKFYLHDGVRTAAAESLKPLLLCAQIHGSQYVQEMWAYICPKLLMAIEYEPSVDVLAEELHSLARCIELLGTGCLPQQQMENLVKIFDKIFVKHFEQQDERDQRRADEDYDQDVEEKLEEEDDDAAFVLSKLGDLIHALFATYKESLIPLFNQILPHVVALLNQKRPWTDHQWGLCIFGDVVEFLGPASSQYQEHFIQPFLHYITDSEPEVRQAAAYAWGVLGQFGGPQYASICSNALPRLIELINAAGSRKPKNVNPTENAISAATKILKYNASEVNVNDVLPMWFSWLPVYEDVNESPHVYGYLCDLVEANHPVILGSSNEELPRVIAVIADSIALETVPQDHEVAKRMISLCKQLQANANLFNACLAALDEGQKQALSVVMSGQHHPS